VKANREIRIQYICLEIPAIRLPYCHSGSGRFVRERLNELADINLLDGLRFMTYSYRGFNQ